MLPHFKKAQIQSLSFEKGLSENELRGFLKVFSDLKTHSTAESIKTALEQIGDHSPQGQLYLLTKDD